MCERLRVDSRRYAGTIVSDGKSMPVPLSNGEMFNVYLQPRDSDWRLDSFEARNVNMTMDLTVTVTAPASTTAERASVVDGLRACILINGWFVNFRREEWVNSSTWVSRCLNLQGRDVDSAGRNATFVYVDDSGDKTTDTADAKPAPPDNTPAGRTSTFVMKDNVGHLPRRADGWRVLVWNNGSITANVSVVILLNTRSVNCSDKRDGPSLPIENTRSLAFRDNRHVGARGPQDQCSARKLPYCDNSFSSGRQLDRCFVCGGDCFLPDCAVGACVSEGIYLSAVRFLGEFASPNTPGEIGRVFHFDTWTEGWPCPSPTSPTIPCKGIDCNVRGGCKGRVETYKVNTDFMDIIAGQTHVFEAGSFVYDPPDDKRLVTIGLVALVRATRLTFSYLFPPIVA